MLLLMLLLLALVEKVLFTMRPRAFGRPLGASVGSAPLSCLGRSVGASVGAGYSHRAEAVGE